ncbi:MAG: hypothetical protein HOW73_21030 [Polyangiaceae bacterium]|nr:hypothetical protein [Polyangiaceae bacterium]
MTTRMAVLGIVGACALGAGCADDKWDPSIEDMEDVDEASLAATCPDVSGTNIQRSMVVTDPEVLSKFAFSRIVSRIRLTANLPATETNVALFQRWMRSFDASPAAGDCDDARIDPNGYGIVCPRLPEAKLATVNPFAAASTVKFEPVGLFNRFDLAPTNGAHCGEYRIVYAMNSTNPNISGRAFIIFEGMLPNPAPQSGIDGCLPVAQFWQGLTADADVNSRAAKLEKFYITGGAVPGAAPVVEAAHYGLAEGATAAHGSGQVRTNFFVDFAEWHLREFRLRRTCTTDSDLSTCKLAFEHVTVKVNPAEELFTGTHPKSASFVTNFVNQVPTLAAAGLNGIKMNPQNQFNEFESISQATNVVYANFDNAAIRNAVATKLSQIGSTLTPDQIFHRATTQTCAGCHQVSPGQALGGGLTWPSTLGFVHIDEASNLSPALTSVFLPRRKQVMEKFINDRCDGSVPAAEAADVTIGGSPIDAAN